VEHDRSFRVAIALRSCCRCCLLREATLWCAQRRRVVMWYHICPKGIWKPRRLLRDEQHSSGRTHFRVGMRPHVIQYEQDTQRPKGVSEIWSGDKRRGSDAINLNSGTSSFYQKKRSTAILFGGDYARRCPSRASLPRPVRWTDEACAGRSSFYGVSGLSCARRECARLLVGRKLFLFYPFPLFHLLHFIN